MKLVLLESLAVWWPEVILSVGALVVLLVTVFSKQGRLAQATTWAVLLAAAAALINVPTLPSTDTFFGLILCDPFSLVFRWLALGAVAMVVLLINGSTEISKSIRGECYSVLLLICVGLMVMAEANHLLMAYVGMELVSLGSYVLVGFLDDSRSSEASLKYLLFGALASGVMLFGISLLYGLTGALAFSDIQRVVLGMDPAMKQALTVAVMLMMVGFAFKISMVPFHMWTPDIYEGAPIAIAALLSIGPKAAGLALFLRVMESLRGVWPMLEGILIVLAILTMTLGNVAALVQSNVKRMLAYSTIGQVGYLLIGFVVHTHAGTAALMLYLVAYLFMNMGMFACLIAVFNDTGSESLEAFRGLSKRAPALALFCTLFLLSLAGIPPLLGFFGKFLLFGAALQAHHVGLAVAGIINSAIALYYYVNIIRMMYLAEVVSPKPLYTGLSIRLAVWICGFAILFLGLFPGPLLTLVGSAAFVNLL